MKAVLLLIENFIKRSPRYSLNYSESYREYLTNIRNTMCGKTTLVSKIPDSLLLATEPGYKAIPGVMAVDINSWTDALTVASQLKKPQAKEKYRVIAIDTLDEFVFMAQQHVLSSNGVNSLSDIPYGNGYILLETTLRKFFRDIIQSYGLIVIAHDGKKQDENDKDIYYASLNFNKKVKRVVMGMLDVLAYVEASRDASEPNIMHFRGSEKWEAKARFPHIVSSIEFSYENLVKAIQDAVKQDATTHDVKQYIKEEKSEIAAPEFEAFKAQVSELAYSKVEEFGQARVLELISAILAGKKLKDTDISDYGPLKNLQENLIDLK